MTNKYITEVKDEDGKVLGKVVTEEPLSEEEIAELTEAYP
jgi:F0F1-type ATP synthase delta subunit